jgi:hypothetical protein
MENVLVIRWRPSLFLAICFALFVGCGDSRGRVSVTGTVLFDGQPLESGAIRFGGDQGAAGVGEIVNGHFSLSENASQKGVLPGRYGVFISSWIEERGSVRSDGSFSPGITRIPLIYLDPANSGLTGEVKAGQANRFTFELKSEMASNAAANAKQAPR